MIAHCLVHYGNATYSAFPRSAMPRTLLHALWQASKNARAVNKIDHGFPLRLRVHKQQGSWISAIEGWLSDARVMLSSADTVVIVCFVTCKMKNNATSFRSPPCFFPLRARAFKFWRNFSELPPTNFQPKIRWSWMKAKSCCCCPSSTDSTETSPLE